MRFRKGSGLLVGSALLLALPGCAHVISSEYRQEAPKNVTFTLVRQDPKAYIGTVVIWGGTILETLNTEEGSELLVLETPLDYGELPQPSEKSRGRFIAKSSSFLDPAIYKKGRKVTLAGEVAGEETRPLGGTEYTYPVVTIKELHLWQREAYAVPPPFYGPGWDWYGPFPYDWPYGWGGYVPYYRPFESE